MQRNKQTFPTELMKTKALQHSWQNCPLREGIQEFMSNQINTYVCGNLNTLGGTNWTPKFWLSTACLRCGMRRTFLYRSTLLLHSGNTKLFRVQGTCENRHQSYAGTHTSHHDLHEANYFEDYLLTVKLAYEVCLTAPHSVGVVTSCRSMA